MKKSEHIKSIVKIIQNGCDLIHTGVWQEREDRYLEIIKRYNKDLCKACAATTIGDDIPHEVRTLADECSGGGAMLIASRVSDLAMKRSTFDSYPTNKRKRG